MQSAEVIRQLESESPAVVNLLKYIYDLTTFSDDGVMNFMRHCGKQIAKQQERDVNNALQLLWPVGLMKNSELITTITPELTYRSFYESDTTLLDVYLFFKLAKGSFARLYCGAFAFIMNSDSIYQNQAKELICLPVERCCGLASLLYIALTSYSSFILEKLPKGARILGSLHLVGKLLNCNLFCEKCVLPWCSSHCGAERWVHLRRVYKLMKQNNNKP